MLSKLALVFVALFPMVSVVNAGNSNADQIIQLAKELKLSNHPLWIKLLHYERSIGTSPNLVSAIHDTSFFNSKDGAFDAHAELEATIRAFHTPISDSSADSHAQCKFPARLIWLKKSLGKATDALQTVYCTKYAKWVLNGSIKSVSVVYASGFLGNPASYYGHILLKFNSRGSNGAARLFDPSINYGAIIPPNENPITYIAKGIFGGYDGGFSQTDYYFHNHNYGELELRDIWEYEINLEQKDVDFIAAHAWEVLGKRYTYYFFRKNCAYRLAELIEVVDDVTILPSNPLFTLPRTLLQNMYESHIHGKPLIRSVNFRPSRQSRFYKKFDLLKSSERSELRKVVENGSGNFFEVNKTLSMDSQIKVVDAALDYYQFAKSAKIMAKDKAGNLHRKALVKRFHLPSGSSGSLKSSLNPPHRGRKSSYVQVGVTYNESFGSGYSIRVRPAYYDVLDATSGQVQNSALTMGEVELFAQSGELHITHFDFLKIESVNTASTNLLGDTGEAWKIKFSVQQQDLSCTDCLTTRLEGDYGYALNLNPRVLVSAYVAGGVQGNRKGSGRAFIRASAFAHIKFTNSFNMRLGVQLPKQVDGSSGQTNRYVLEARQRLGVNTDMRFSYEENKSRQYGVNVGYYF